MNKSWIIAASAAAFMSFAGTAYAEGDAELGKKVFKKCGTCHAVGEGAKKKVGPVLNNIMDAKAGVIEGFKYSKAMVAAGEEGITWTEENLDLFLTKPKSFIKKTKMSFAGLKKEDDRANVIAYLKTFSE